MGICCRISFVGWVPEMRPLVLRPRVLEPAEGGTFAGLRAPRLELRLGARASGVNRRQAMSESPSLAVAGL